MPAAPEQQEATQDTSPAPVAAQAATPASVPGDTAKAADAQPAASDGASVVTSPSLTSLADAAAGTASGAPSRSTTATNLAVASATASPKEVSAESSLSEVAVTSGFRVTGFRVPSIEQAPELAGSGVSTASSAGISSRSGGVPAAPEPPPPSPAGGSDAADPAAGIARRESLGHAEVLDAVCASVPLPHPLLLAPALQKAAQATDASPALAVEGPAAAREGIDTEENSVMQAHAGDNDEVDVAAVTGSEGQASPTCSAVSI